MAFVSRNDAKVEKEAKNGNKKAKQIYKMLKEPSKFLATIQIGITLAGFLSSAFASESFADDLAPILNDLMPLGISTWNTISIVLITIILSYFTLVFGELVPKRLAMKNYEKIAFGSIGIIRGIAIITSPFVKLLTFVTNTISKLFGVSETDEETVTEEEIKMMINRYGEDSAFVKGFISARENPLFAKKQVDYFDTIIQGHVHFKIYEESTSTKFYSIRAVGMAYNMDPIDTASYVILKEKVNKEGLFNPDIKKAIPKIPKKVGIVRAPTGAAIKDIISTIKRRYPLCETILFPALVQGDAAAADIARKIKLAEQYDIDTLIVGRGGGSIEDLWAFNEEIVARAIYECSIPVISAVGHEIDYTIADFVADLRAPTPTGAAEIAVPHVSDLETLLHQLQIRLKENIYKKVNYNKLYLESVKNSFVIKNPMIMYENKKQQLDIMLDKINGVVSRKLELEHYRLDKLKQNYLLQNPKELYYKHVIQLDNMIEKLELLNPLGVLKRGYALPYVGGEIVKSVNKVKVNDQVILKLHDGEIEMKVEHIKEEKHGS